MTKKYQNIKQYENKILELKSQGFTHREIGGKRQKSHRETIHTVAEIQHYSLVCVDLAWYDSGAFHGKRISGDSLKRPFYFLCRIVLLNFPNRRWLQLVRITISQLTGRITLYLMNTSNRRLMSV